MYATGCSGSCISTAAAIPSISAPSYSTSTLQTQRPNYCTLPNPNFFCPSSNFSFKRTHSSPRLTGCHTTRKQPKHWVSSFVNDRKSEAYPDLELPSPVSNDSSSMGDTIDIKLPRRSLLASFTCNACGERSQRLVNRLAYERGTVYVQCSGCSQYHKLVDNLNLVVEYDFREVIGLSTDVEQA